jgi:hypothetical protein
MSKIIKGIVKLQVDKLIRSINEDIFSPEDWRFGKADTAKTIKNFKSVDGDEDGASLARADSAIQAAKSNLASLGVNVDSLDSVYSIEMLSEAGFTIYFKIKEKEKDEFDTDIVVAEHRGRAKVNKELSSIKDGKLAIDLQKGGDVEGTIIFNPKELDVNLPNTRKSFKGLQNGKKYTVYLQGGGITEPKQEEDGPIDKSQVYKLYATILGYMGLNIYDKIGIKKDFPIVNNFIEQAVAKQDDKLLSKYYNKYKEYINVTEDEFLTKVKDENFLKVASWMSRNKKAGVGKDLWSRIANEFPEFEMEGRKKQITSKPGKEAGKPVPDENKGIQDSIMSLTNILLESVNQEKWSKIVGLPLDYDKFKNLITNLENILRLLSNQYRLSYNKSKVKEYVGKYLNESFILEADGDTTDTTDTTDGDSGKKLYLLHLSNIDLGSSEKDSDEKRERDRKKYDGSGKLPARGEIVKIIKSNNPSFGEDSEVNKINNMLNSGVYVRPSIQDKNNLVVELNDGSALVVKSMSGESLVNLFKSGSAPAKGLKNYKVILGKKMGGSDELKEDAEAELTLVPVK